ncbi:hypothetical protein RCOM_1516650 [Ricinus communis]|uniref:F-box domain-containing protein n=1 Tax=Ricinus communis TaxID=3988 RepID=B9SDC9_RICCO|nr:hypothetical protein RCOM_1516650 [Ricinus communis]
MESIPKHSEETKKQSLNIEDNTLLPGLPDDLALLCLTSLPYALLFSVCRAWHPLSSKWKALPNPSTDPPLHLIYHHPSFLSRNLPLQSLTVSNHLVLIAGTTHPLVPAFSRPLFFHPQSNHWLLGPPFTK